VKDARYKCRLQDTFFSVERIRVSVASRRKKRLCEYNGLCN